MSAEVLRRAAASMRERAELAMVDASDAWEAIPSMDPGNDGWIVAHSPSHADYDTTQALCVYDYEGHTARHIASWHPVVALAVADWLEQVADQVEQMAKVTAALNVSVDLADLHATAPLAVARAYLGETA